MQYATKMIQGCLRMLQGCFIVVCHLLYHDTPVGSMKVLRKLNGNTFHNNLVQKQAQNVCIAAQIENV